MKERRKVYVGCDKRIPAGTFLVPMLVSALVYTIWSNLFQIGGLTEHIFGGGGTNGIIGAVPMVVYGIASGGGMDWTPVISIPMFTGVDLFDGLNPGLRTEFD